MQTQGGVQFAVSISFKNRTDQVTFFAEGTVPSFGRGIGKTHEMVSKLAGVPERTQRKAGGADKSHTCRRKS
ncbi:MAG: hypothetical protein ACLS8D_18885 [Clostridioides difficile]